MRGPPQPCASGRGVPGGGLRVLSSLLAAAGEPGLVLSTAEVGARQVPSSSALGPTGARGSGSATVEPPPVDEGPEHVRVEALLQLAQGGDAQAFGEIYELYVDVVYRYVYFRVGSRVLAEDLTSETFLRALRRLDSFRWQGRDIAAWFVTIARNLIADHVKSSRYKLEVATAELVDAAGADAQAGPEARALQRLEDAALVKAMRTLRPDQLECLVLRFFDGLSLAETAEVLGRSEGAVKQLQLRGVRALNARMTEAGTAR